MPLDELIEHVRRGLAARIVEQPLGTEQQAAGRGGGDEGGGELSRHGGRIAEPEARPYAIAGSKRRQGFRRARCR